MLAISGVANITKIKQARPWAFELEPAFRENSLFPSVTDTGAHLELEPAFRESSFFPSVSDTGAHLDPYPWLPLALFQEVKRPRRERNLTHLTSRFMSASSWSGLQVEGQPVKHCRVDWVQYAMCRSVDTQPGTNVTQQHLWAPAVCPLHRFVFSSLGSACCLLPLVSRSAISSTLKIEAICFS
jgi:hypothetical protein